MTRTSIATVLLVLVLSGCAHMYRDLAYSHEEMNAYQMEQYRKETCQRNMPVLPAGSTVARPYMVVTRIDAEGNAEDRWAKLRERACDLGGDAVIGVETIYEQRENKRRRIGRAIAAGAASMQPTTTSCRAIGNTVTCDSYGNQPRVADHDSDVETVPVETGFVIRYTDNAR